jgi:HSP20 family protein
MVESSHVAGFWPALFDPLRQFGGRVADWFAPRSEAAEDGDVYEITLELPGVEADAIDVSANDGVLSVKGEKRAERTESGKTWYFTEREYGSFQRSFRLPPDADDSAVSADFTNGVLRISVPKKAPTKPEARKVPITSR